MLKDIVPAQYRKIAYAIYAVAGVVLGVLQIVGETPDFTGTALEVYAYIGIALGLTAASNTDPKDE